jgi:hypothetical protein
VYIARIHFSLKEFLRNTKDKKRCTLKLFPESKNATNLQPDAVPQVENIGHLTVATEHPPTREACHVDISFVNIKKEIGKLSEAHFTAKTSVTFIPPSCFSVERCQPLPAMTSGSKSDISSYALFSKMAELKRRLLNCRLQRRIDEFQNLCRPFRGFSSELNQHKELAPTSPRQPV